MAQENTSLLNLDGFNIPFSLEAEQAVLGCILIDPPSLTNVQTMLRAEHFYLPQHQSIFGAMVSLDAVNGKIDPLLVLNKLTEDKTYDEAAGKNYLYQLSQAVPSTANLESYCRIVREKYYLRSLIGISREIIDSASTQEEAADTILDSAEQKIYDIRQGKMTSGPSKISDIIVNEVYDRLGKLTSPEKDLYKGIPTGFSDLDEVLTGLNRSDLILLGARPAMGKTSFALNVARNVALLAKKKVLFFSLEMTKEQLAQRVLAMEARIDVKSMRTGMLSDNDWQNLGMATALLNDCELYFDDSSNITVTEMKARTRRLRGVDCVFIDYLGLISPSNKRVENRVQAVSEITRSLKLMAKDLAIPVFCCSQLNRGPEARSGKSHRPQLSELRESGSIEQDADIVMMLYREEYYNNGDDSDDDEDEAPENQGADITEVIIAKNRHGPTQTVKLVFDKQFTLFKSLEKYRDDR